MKIYQKIRFFRECQNLSQEKMAEKLNMSRSAYAKIESGESDVKYSKLEDIAKVLNIDLLELFSLGEKNIMMFSSHCGSQCIHQNKTEIELKNQEINYLKEIIDLLKSKSL